MTPADDDVLAALAELLAAEADDRPPAAPLAERLERDAGLRAALVEQLAMHRLLRQRVLSGQDVDLAPRVLASIERREQQLSEQTMAVVRRHAGAEPAPPARPRLAIISDIHANLEALEVVLADIATRGIRDVVCLGDIVGYGPNPRECLELVAATARFSLLGNHEEAVLFHAEDFNAKARRAIDWTREQINASDDRAANYALWDFLGELRKEVREGSALYVHGSPRQPTREYVLPTDARDGEKMAEIFGGFDAVCFCGHTHIAGAFTEGTGRFDPAARIGHERTILPGAKVLINVGAVGQPRDGDARACYVTVEDGVVRWHRLAYDIEATMAKIAARPALSDSLAGRLREGR